MIVITGATGALNGATVDHLLALRPDVRIAVAVRDPARAARFAARGVEIRGGADYADPGALPRAFESADQLLLVSSNDPGANTVSLHRAAIAAAVSAGVGRILYTSHQGAGHDSPFAPAAVHAATEDLLAESGVPWTSLRNGFYAHSLDWLAGPWRETGVVTVPADGPVSWTWREDAAEAAAHVLVADGSFDGPVTMTAAEALTFEQVATLAAEIHGKPVRFARVEPERWLADQIRTGAPEFRARFTLGMYTAAAQGRFADTDPTLERLLGRPARSVRDLLATR